MKTLKNSKWTRLGSFFPQAHTSVFVLDYAEGSTQRDKLIENDKFLPIVIEAKDIAQKRIDIFESICEALGAEIFEYFYHSKVQLTELNKILSEQIPGYPKPAVAFNEKNIKRSSINDTVSTIAALVEILAYAFSEKQQPHKTTKSKNFAKNGYTKDVTYKSLKKILAVMESTSKQVSESSIYHLPEIEITDYVKKFLCDFHSRYADLKENREQLSIRLAKKEIELLIEELEKISNHANELRNNLIVYAEHLRIYFSDRHLSVTPTYIDSKNGDPAEFEKYKNETVPKIIDIIKQFEINNAPVSIERMALIQAAIYDCSELLDLKPSKTIKKITQTIQEYRNKYAMYPDKQYEPRGR